jgi:hypothetical protein
MTTAATTGDLKVHIKAHYAGQEPLGDVDVRDLGNDEWMAYPDPELTDNDDKREFLAVVFRAKRDFHLVAD